MVMGMTISTSLEFARIFQIIPIYIPTGRRRIPASPHFFALMAIRLFKILPV
jgi:hypothetical protein